MRTDTIFGTITETDTKVNIISAGQQNYYSKTFNFAKQKYIFLHINVFSYIVLGSI